MHIPIKTLIPNGKQSLKLFDTSLQPSIPIPLRLGDFNLDGFPDILGVIYNETSQDSQAVLFENIPNNKSERTLSYLNNYSKFQSLNSINETRILMVSIVGGSWNPVDVSGIFNHSKARKLLLSAVSSNLILLSEIIYFALFILFSFLFLRMIILIVTFTLQIYSYVKLLPILYRIKNWTLF